MSPQLRICLSLYRRLADAYPHEFRMVYGEDLDQLGEDAASEAWRRYGLVGLLRLLADLAVRLPVEYLAEIRRDVAYSLRVLARSPGFAAVGILSIGIGIGMCSVILYASNAMLGPTPGVRDPAALVAGRRGVSYPYFEHYRDQRQVAAAAAVFIASVPFAVAPTADRHARAERFSGHLVSPDYFSTLGVTPAAGRFFSAATEKPGMTPVVVDSLVTGNRWAARFGPFADLDLPVGELLTFQPCFGSAHLRIRVEQGGIGVAAELQHGRLDHPEHIKIIDFGPFGHIRTLPLPQILFDQHCLLVQKRRMF